MIKLQENKLETGSNVVSCELKQPLKGIQTPPFATKMFNIRWEWAIFSSFNAQEIIYLITQHGDLK